PPGRARTEPMNLRCFNPQFFIASRVGDVALEHDWEDGASDDDQLSVVIEAVRVLCAAVPVDGLLPADRAALDRLKSLRRPAGSGHTAAADASITTADVDNLIAKLRVLRDEDPESAGRIIRRVVEEAGPPAPIVVD
ncbi:MAG TPA: hypothetical protein VMU14_20125, partial [Acidimicrobiales bacterium]|nr:hypothetical protein [Acidimicrobiales bacterium]